MAGDGRWSGRIRARATLAAAVCALTAVFAPALWPSGAGTAAPAPGLPPAASPTAAAGAGKAEAAATREVRAGLERLLDHRAAAVLDRDEQAYLETVHPGAAALRDRQRQVFANLAGVPLASWSYRITGRPAAAGPGTVTPVAPGADGGGPRITAEVELAYRFAKAGTPRYTGTEQLVFVRHAGRWCIAAVAPGSADGTGGRERQAPMAQLWDLGPVHAATGRHSLVLGLAGKARLRRLAAEADRAVPAVDRLWRGRWSRTVVLQLPRTRAQMAALLGGSEDAYRGLAAVTQAATGRTAAAPAASADRIVVNPEAYATLSDLGRRVVLTHETVHVATRAHTAAWTPMWLSEGFADWIGYLGSGRTPESIAPELARRARAGRPPQRLPEDADFAAVDPADVAAAYEGAWYACRLIAERYGPGRLRAFYRAVAEQGRDGADPVMRRVLGVDLAGFTRTWRTEAVRELG